MATLEQRLNDPEYRNWVKTVLCLQYVRDGLVDFAEVKSQDLHRKVLYQLQHYGNPSANRLCQNISFNFRKKSIACCANCNGILAEILKYRNGNQSLNLTNTDPSKLLTEHWQVAKVFMNTGQDVTNADPNQTDISGLLNFLEKCSEPAQCITVPSNVEQVRLFRNQIIHTSDMKISDGEFKKIIPVLLALLEDPGYLLNDSRAMAAATGIKEVTSTDFRITTVNEIAVLRDFVHEQTELLRSEADTLRGEVLDCSSQMNEDLKTQQEKLNDLEGKMEKVQIAIESLKSAINAHKAQQDTLLHDISSIEEKLKSTKEGIESLCTDINSRMTELEKKQRQTELKQSITNKQVSTLKRKFVSFEQEAIKKRKVPSPENCPTEEDKNRLVKYLKEGYRDILKVRVSSGFQHLPVSEIFAPVILIKGDKEGNKPRNDTSQPDQMLKKESGPRKELQSYKEILQNVEVHRPIFLLGEAGTGKTTFCKHLTDLWCNESTTFQFQNPEVLARYRFVFQVSCRFAEENDSVFDMICKQLFDDVSLKRIAEYLLTQSPEECFIILDGLDEWKGSPVHSTGRRGDIQGIPGTKGVEKSLILITSRPWRFQALPTVPEKKDRIFELSGLKSPKMLTTVILKKMGYTDPEESCEEFLSEVERCSMLEMIQIPLIFQIVLNIWHENKTLHKSICQNYMSLVNSFIERADRPQIWTGDERRLMEPLVYNIDYWKRKWSKSFDSFPVCCKKFEPFEQFAGLIMSLSQVAFDFLFNESESGIQQKLVFSWDDCKRYLSKKELDICLGIGIISKSQSHRGMYKVENYSFIHKTVQEFLAALWLAKSNGVTSESIRKHLTKSPFEFEILITFLCGFAPEAGADLLCDLNKDYWEDQRFVLRCWEESKNCNDTTYTCFTLSKLTLDYLDKDDIRLLINYLEASPTHTNTLENIDIRELEEDQEERLFGCLFSLHLPVIRNVNFDTCRPSGGTINHFCQSVSNYVTLENFSLRHLYNDNSSQDKLAEMDLRNHYKLEILRLTNLSLKTILLPLETNTCLTHLTINNDPEFEDNENPRLCLSHNGMNQFYHSLSGCVNLVYLYLDNISCSDHTCKGDFWELDLQKLQKLEQLELRNLSAKTALCPQTTESRLRVLKINTNKYNIGQLCHIYLSHSGMDQFYQSLSGCISLEKIVLNNISCRDDDPKEHSTALDLQKFRKLEVLEIRNLSVKTVLFPQETESCLRNLVINAYTYSDYFVTLSDSEYYDECLFLSRGGMDQFYQSLSGCISLENIVLNNISCRDDDPKEHSTALDLQKFRKLEVLEIRNLSVKTVLFPQETESCLRNLVINAYTYSDYFVTLSDSEYYDECLFLSRGGMDQFYQSLSGCISLERIVLNNISCRDDNPKEHSTALDLQKFCKLEVLEIRNISVKTVLFPQETESCLRLLEINTDEYLEDLPCHLNLSHSGMDQFYQSLSGCFSLEKIVLNNISCRDDNPKEHSTALDLQKFCELEVLKIRNLSVETVLFPQETESCLRNLVINAYTSDVFVTHSDSEYYDESLFLSRGGMDQFYQSLSGCISLEKIVLNNISCRDDNPKEHSTALDLQKFRKLEVLEIRNFSLKTVLLPQETESCLRNVCINADPYSVERHFPSLSGYSDGRLNLSRNDTDQFGQPLSICCSLKTIVLTNTCCDDICGNHSSVIDLQKSHELHKLELRCLLVEAVLFPQETESCLYSLKIHELKLVHGGFERLPFLSQKQSCFSISQLYQSISRCVNMQQLELNNISCSDKSCGSVSILNLQNLYKLVELELRCLLVEAVLFSQEVESRLYSLKIHELKLVHGGFEGLSVFSQNQSCFSISQLYESISRCVNLRCLDLKTISCSDKSCCSVSILDLQNLHQLKDIQLQNLPLTTVLLPKNPNFSPRILTICLLQLTHESIEELHTCICSAQRIFSLKLFAQNIVCADHGTGCERLQSCLSGDDNHGFG